MTRPIWKDTEQDWQGAFSSHRLPLGSAVVWQKRVLPSQIQSLGRSRYVREPASIVAGTATGDIASVFFGSWSTQEQLSVACLVHPVFTASTIQRRGRSEHDQS